MLRLVLLCFLLTMPSFAWAQTEVPRLFPLTQPSTLLPELDTDRLRFVTTSDFPPLNFVDSSGRLTGFHIDLARALCEQLVSLERCEIEAVPYSEVISIIRNNNADVALAGIGINTELRQFIDFSRPFMVQPARFVTLKNTTLNGSPAVALSGKRVGVLRNTAHERYLIRYFPQVELSQYELPALMYDELRQGKIAAVFGDGMQLSIWLTEQQQAPCCVFVEGPYYAPRLFGAGIAAALPPGRQALRLNINQALRNLETSGQLQELILRYFPHNFYAVYSQAGKGG